MGENTKISWAPACILGEYIENSGILGAIYSEADVPPVITEARRYELAKRETANAD
jgi:hypothetical protein